MLKQAIGEQCESDQGSYDFTPEHYIVSQGKDYVEAAGKNYL